MDIKQTMITYTIVEFKLYSATKRKWQHIIYKNHTTHTERIIPSQVCAPALAFILLVVGTKRYRE